MWGYGSLCMAIFTVRTIKRIIFHEARQYREIFPAPISAGIKINQAPDVEMLKVDTCALLEGAMLTCLLGRKICTSRLLRACFGNFAPARACMHALPLLRQASRCALYAGATCHP